MKENDARAVQVDSLFRKKSSMPYVHAEKDKLATSNQKTDKNKIISLSYIFFWLLVTHVV